MNETIRDEDAPATPSRHLYRKKPVTIRAVQVRWSTWSDVCNLLGPALKAENPDGARFITADEASDTCGEPGPEYIAFEVRTVHGELATVRHGDWVIPEKTPGRFYPCKPDVFAETYEPAEQIPGQQEIPADLPGFRGAGDCEPCQGTGLNIGLPGNCPVCGGTGNALVHAEELDEHGHGTGHARCDTGDGTFADGPIADSSWQVTCEKCLSGEAPAAAESGSAQ